MPIPKTRCVPRKPLFGLGLGHEQLLCGPWPRGHLAQCLSLDDSAGLPQLSSWGASVPHKQLLPLSKIEEGETDPTVLDALAVMNPRVKTKLDHRNYFYPQVSPLYAYIALYTFIVNVPVQNIPEIS